jgi:uncharacterized protein (DUF4415 family)
MTTKREVHMLGDPWWETDEGKAELERRKRLPPHADSWWETDEGEEEIQMRIAENPDDEEITDEMWAQRTTLAEAHPELAESIKRSRGRPPVENRKEHISLRLDPDVIAKFKATGPGWQSRINEVLKKADV